MTRAFTLIVVALSAQGLLAACDPSVSVIGNGGAGGSPSTATSTTVSSSSSSTSVSSTAATSSSVSSSSSGGTCPPKCTTDADCQNSCPSSGPQYTNCCDPPTGICYVSSVSICPLACAPGAICQPGTCTVSPSSCIEQCTCDDTGHYVCKTKADLPTCPAVHPTCGESCDPSVLLGCKCTLGPGQGEAPCTCDAATSKWLCSDPSIPCPPSNVMQQGATCTDFPAGLLCNFACFCQAECGTQYWYCGL